MTIVKIKRRVRALCTLLTVINGLAIADLVGILLGYLGNAAALAAVAVIVSADVWAMRVFVKLANMAEAIRGGNSGGTTPQ